MAILLEVKWVEQSDRPEADERIRSIGGDSQQFHWRHTQAQAIESIERKQFIYFAHVLAGNLRLEVALTTDGHKYLSILNGGGNLQSLLSLPGLPAPSAD